MVPHTTTVLTQVLQHPSHSSSMVWGSQNYGFTGTQDEFTFTNVKLQRFSSETGGTIQNTENPPDKTLEDTDDKVEGDDDDGPTFRTSRRMIIEPSLIVAFMMHMANYSLISQYLYYAIGEKYNLTAIMAGEADKNGTGGGEGDPGCGGIEQNKNSTAYVLQQKTQAEAARFSLYIDIVTDVPGFITMLFFGEYCKHRYSCLYKFSRICQKVQFYVFKFMDFQNLAL